MRVGVGVDIGVGRPGSPGATLLSGLLSYWRMDEAAGAVRVDRGPSAANLTDTSTGGNKVHRAVGKIDYAFEVLSGRAGQIDLSSGALAAGTYMPSGGTNPLYTAGWVYFDALKVSGGFGATIIHKISGDGEQGLQLIMGYDGSAYLAAVSTSPDGTGDTIAAFAGGPVISTWYLAETYYNPATGVVGIAVNGSAFTTATGTSGNTWGPDRPEDVTAALAADLGSGEQYRGCEFGVWNRMPSTVERAYLLGGHRLL